MTNMWVIAWVEARGQTELGAVSSYKDMEMYMAHTFSQNYAKRLIRYLEDNGIPYKWSHVTGFNLSSTGDVVAHLRRLSTVVKEVFGAR